jgi:hypothetical protein
MRTHIARLIMLEGAQYECGQIVDVWVCLHYHRPTSFWSVLAVSALLTV